jgi:cellulose synthase/poly-beta-1,6-N-acetylglucosamine synthase-like glycosyltransferase
MYWLTAILILPYFILLLNNYRRVLNIKTFNISSEPITFVSVVVACRNEQENLPYLLDNIARQDYPGELFELIIVNDNSSDSTIDIAEGFKGTLNILTINNDGKGKKQALRTGIKASSGYLIITTDADCRMDRSWIKTIAAFFEQHRPDMIIGPVQLESGPGFLRRFQELEFLSLQGITAGSAISGDPTMCNGANLSFTRVAYQDNSENLHDIIASGDDIFFLHSLKKNNKSKILWLESSAAIVTTAASRTVREYMDQRRRWISKAKAYNDISTITFALVTFVTIILQLSLLVAGFFNTAFWPVFLTISLIKSIPDYLILQNASRRYGRKKLMKWFLPAQVVYPFYVMFVVVFSIISYKKPGY